MIGDDRLLVLQLRKGNLDAFETLVERWRGPLFQFLFRHLPSGQHAEDLLQDVFLRVYRNHHTYDFRSKFSTWVYSIALNLCRDWYRKQGRRLERGQIDQQSGLTGAGEPSANLADPNPLPDRQLETHERIDMVRAAMLELPAHLREIVILKEYQDLTFQQIAKLQNAPVSTVKSRMYLALDLLGKQLRRRGIVKRSRKHQKGDQT